VAGKPNAAAAAVAAPFSMRFLLFFSQNWIFSLLFGVVAAGNALQLDG
jgi:hypothetical protein